MFKNYSERQRSSERYARIYAPLTGEFVKIEDIPDPVFAQK